MVVKKAKLTPEEQRQARIAELDAVEGMRQADMARRLAMKAESDAFMAKAAAARTARAAAIEAGTYEPPVIPSVNQYYEALAAEERAAAEEAERQRIAQLNPRDVWLSTRPL